MTRDRLAAQLTADEGSQAFAYTDTAGKVTIGVGRNLSDVGLSREEIALLLDHDITRVCALLTTELPWWTTLDEVRQRALANLCFNMGIGSLLKFVRFLMHLRGGDYPRAADALRDSTWATQVGKRATRIEGMIRTGLDPVL